jgi:ribosomal protein S18 acetylase RimI-like enzyme
MSSSPADGFHIRSASADDVELVTKLIVSEEEALRGSSRWTEAQTRDWFHGLAGNGDMRIVEDGGRPLGLVGLFFGPLTRGWIVLDQSQETERAGPVLVELAEQLAREQEATRVQIGAFAENRAAIEHLRSAGFVPDRHFFTMQIELNGRLPAPQWPEGITCTTFEPSEARAFYDAMLDAFADDTDFQPLPFDEWKRRQLGAPEFDASLWFAARDGRQIAGVARCWRERWGCGWVDVLGVRKPWRRRGLGLALLHHAFRVFHERGRTCVGLEVDTENPTDATRLYERAGMRIVAKDVMLAKDLG